MLPPQLAPIILTLAPVFNRRTWEHALVLLWGAILAPGKRTVTSALRIMGQALTDWARQLLLQLRRWLPERELVRVADGGFAALDLLTCLAGLRQPITCITRLRLDARLYDTPAPRRTGKAGRPRLVGVRLPNLQQVLANRRTRWKTVAVENWYGQTSRTVQLVAATAIWYHAGFAPLPIRWVLIRDPQKRFDPVALLCTDPQQPAEQILSWFLLRWRVEVTFQEVRAHLGFETQRQWSDPAMARSSPLLLGLFSLIPLLTSRLAKRNSIPLPQTAWYRKTHPSFSDALALVRRHYWRHSGFFTSLRGTEQKKIPLALITRLSDVLCFAA